MALTSTVKAISLTSFDTGGLLAGYNLVNAGGLSHACFKLRITNASTIDLGISFDGVSTVDYMPSDSVFTLDLQNMAGPSGYVCNMAKGTKLYVIAPAAGVGSIYLAGYYQN
jgi:hypothetical protein